MADFVVLKLKDDERIPTNSQLLTSNSLVFNKLLNKLHQTVVDVDDFESEVVKIFLRSLESETVEHFELEQFRDFHKMAVVFEVHWMVTECRDYLECLIDDVADPKSKREPYVYDHMLILFEEACYIDDKWKISEYVDKLINNIQSANKVDRFTEKYMENFLALFEKQLDLMLRLTDENAKVLLQKIKQNIEETNTFDKNSRYLLKNMDLPQAIAQNPTLFVETFDILTLLAGHNNMSHEDTKLILTLHTEATKRYLQTIQNAEDIRKTEESETVQRTPEVPGQIIIVGGDYDYESSDYESSDYESSDDDYEPSYHECVDDVEPDCVDNVEPDCVDDVGSHQSSGYVDEDDYGPHDHHESGYVDDYCEAGSDCEADYGPHEFGYVDDHEPYCDHAPEYEDGYVPDQCDHEPVYEDGYGPDQCDHEPVYEDHCVPDQCDHEPVYEDHYVPDQCDHEPVYEDHYVPDQCDHEPEYEDHYVPDQCDHEPEYEDHYVPDQCDHESEYEDHYVPDQCDHESEYENHYVPDQCDHEPVYEDHYVPDQCDHEPEYADYYEPADYYVDDYEPDYYEH